MTLTEIFEQLIVIPSPTRREGEVAAWIRRFCEQLGFAVETDDVGERIGGESGNLLVRACPPVPQRRRVPGGNGPTLLLCAHIDTVETGDAPIRFTIRDGEYFSDGETILGADDKCGCACLLALLQHVAETGAAPRGDLRVLFTVSEEDMLQGSHYLPEAWLAGVDAAIALDHSTPHEIVTQRPAKEQIDITVRGIGGHACMPDGKLNAAHVLAGVLTRLPTGRIDEQSVCNIGLVRAGRAVNVIPAEATACMEVRSLNPERLKRYADDIEKRIRETVAKAQGASVDITRTFCYPACDVPHDVPAVRLAAEAIAACGLTPGVISGLGGGDANWFCERGLPAVTIGCGQHGPHGSHECATVAEMERCLDVLKRLVNG